MSSTDALGKLSGYHQGAWKLFTITGPLKLLFKRFGCSMFVLSRTESLPMLPNTDANFTATLEMIQDILTFSVSGLRL